MKRLLLALALLGLPAVALAQTAVPPNISYHGRVTDAAGVPIGNNAPVNRAVTFRIYNHKSNTGAARLYSETQTVTIANGEFSVLLGTGTAVSGETNTPSTGGIELALANALSTATGGTERYLGVTVDDPTTTTTTNDPEISPRQQLVSASYALRAKVADGLSGSVSTAQIANGAITDVKLGPDSVTQGAIKADSILNSHLKDGIVTAGKLATDSVTTVKIEALAVTAAKIASDAVTTAKIASDAVTTAKISDGAVTDVKLGPNSVTQGAIAPLSIMNSHIQNGTITADKLAFTPGGGTPAANSVTSSTIVDGTITNADIATGAITAAKFATSSFGYPRFVDGARVDIGLNVNHAGDAGTTSTFVANSSDNYFFKMLDGTTEKFVIAKNGGFSAGGGTATSGFASYAIIKSASSSNLAVLEVQNESAVPVATFNRNGNAQFSGNISATNFSDIRLKRDVRNLDGALEKFLRLRSVTFEYIDPEYGAGTQKGFIAQEMELVFPEWVKTRADGFKGISYNGFESVIVRALQELRAEKEEQLQQRDATIAALEKNVAAMKTEAADTKAQLAALQQAVAALSARASN